MSNSTIKISGPISSSGKVPTSTSATNICKRSGSLMTSSTSLLLKNYAKKLSNSSKSSR
jgi:hypothetical protein